MVVSHFEWDILGTSIVYSMVAIVLLFLPDMHMVVLGGAHNHIDYAQEAW